MPEHGTFHIISHFTIQLLESDVKKLTSISKIKISSLMSGRLIVLTANNTDMIAHTLQPYSSQRSQRYLFRRFVDATGTLEIH